jgi:hypothetical protein
MAYCEFMQRECTEMRRQEDDALSWEAFTDRGLAHRGALKLCEQGLKLSGVTVDAVKHDDCGLLLFDEVEGFQNAKA